MSNLVQITFKADEGLKKTALQKARSEGITLKAFLTMAMKSYVDDRLKIGVGFRDENFDNLFTDKDVIRKANKLGEILETVK